MTSSCTICATYARVRGPRIKAEIAKTTPQRDRAPWFQAFMAGVHDRHLAPSRVAAAPPTEGETR